jgi:hypothetical protein
MECSGILFNDDNNDIDDVEVQAWGRNMHRVGCSSKKRCPTSAAPMTSATNDIMMEYHDGIDCVMR